MKRILTTLLIVGIILSLVGCRKLINTEYKTVEVTITDKYYRSMWLQPITTGKVTTFITHPAVHNITVKYNDIEYTIDDDDTYNKYKDKIGQIATGILEINTYDDNSIQYDIVEIK